MTTSSVLIVCLLVTCSVWTVQAKSLKVQMDDQEQVDVDMSISVEAGRLPGMCWACKWALNKVKKVIGQNATAEKVSSKLSSVCKEIGFLKGKCMKFVKQHLGVLVEELSTTDDVRTICVNVKACSRKESMDQFFYQSNEDSQVEFHEYV
ncbi:uncharacterized protein V6R79_007707 [Siganus canaliculatus]